MPPIFDRRYQIVIVALLIIAMYFVLAYGIFAALTQYTLGGNDFYSRWMGARELLLRSQDPYSDDVTREIQMGMFGQLVPPEQDQVAFAYPLYVTMILAPLVTLSYAQAQALWMALLVFSIICGSLVLTQLYRMPRHPMILAPLFFASILFYPAVRGTFNGQVSIVSYLFLVFSVWAIDLKADVTAGIFLAFATVKPQPMVFLVPVVMAWAVWHRRSKIVVTAIGALGGLVAISLALVPTWLIEFVAAIGFDRLRTLDLPQFSLQRFARLLIGLVVGLTGLSSALGFASDAPLAYLAGFESRDTFLARHLGAYYSAVQFVNIQLPANANVLFLWEPRSYYVQRAVRTDTMLDLIPHARWKYSTADAVVKSWRDAGYMHVLLNRGGLDYMLQTGYDPIQTEDIQVLQEITVSYLSQVYGKTPLEIVSRDGRQSIVGADSDAYAIYAITPAEKLP